jgi:hypothetical protein
MHQSMPVKWYLLIRDAEHVRAVTGLGLASVWTHIHREHYDEARACLDEIAERTGCGTPPLPAAGAARRITNTTEETK